MPLDTAEGIAAAFRELPIFNVVQQAASALPPAETRKAVDYAACIGLEQSGPVYMALVEIDDPVHKAADLIPILGLSQSGPLAQQLIAIDLLIADIAD